MTSKHQVNAKSFNFKLNNSRKFWMNEFYDSFYFMRYVFIGKRRQSQIYHSMWHYIYTMIYCLSKYRPVKNDSMNDSISVSNGIHGLTKIKDICLFLMQKI